MSKNNIKPTNKISLTLQALRREKSPYNVNVLDKSFIAFPGVFSPKYCIDTAFYSAEIPVVSGSRILEIGCGTGIVSIFMLSKGADSVVAIDINPIAIENSIANATMHNLSDRMDVRLGDVFDALNPDERFDLIFWNIPFGYCERNNLSLEEMAMFDSEYNAFKRYIGESENHLNKKGKVLFGCCPTLARFDFLAKTLTEVALTYSVLKEINTLYLDETITFQLLELHRI